MIGLVVGSLTGLVVAFGAAIGINLTALSFRAEYSEALAFAIAAVGAIGGIQLLKARAA